MPTDGFSKQKKVMSRSPKPPCTPETVREVLDSPAFAGCALARTASQQTVQNLCSYLILLEKWNKVMNLVGPAGWQDMLVHLVADSFYLAASISELDLPETPECRDLGAGAGLPGLPLRMIWQKGNYTLVEAREKRALFLSTCLAASPLPGVRIFQGRVERYFAETPWADLTVSRAFLPWEKVLELIDAFTRPGDFCLFLTHAPLPEALPFGWQARSSRAYGTGGGSCHDRHIWALQKS
ncbi:class I SAM-dependent methyltransferase [Desulfovibrio sp. OttesenSCG-928-G15]|nr:class I SAM-dependent methyltransferase [Desulfovibrio sp. OttesenSCG-928-G15]